MKQCNKCWQWKEESEFNKCKGNNDGLRGECKNCRRNYHKEYKKNNKEYLSQKRKENYENNKEHEKKKMKEWKGNNKEREKELKRRGGKKSQKFPLKWNSQSRFREEIKLYEEIRESENGNVECKCAYCGEWFEPTRLQVKHRLNAIDGKLSGELRLYCSDKCKENCPIYKQKIYPKDQKPATSREVQPQLRQIVFERDNYTCQKCDTHKDDLDVGIHCHHKFPLNEDPIESADTDNCITLCENCHKEIHQKPGCTSSELRCNN